MSLGALEDFDDVLEVGDHVRVFDPESKTHFVGVVTGHANAPISNRSRVYSIRPLRDVVVRPGIGLGGDYLRDHLRRMSLLEVLAAESA